MMNNFVKSVVGCVFIGFISVGMSGCGGASVSPMEQERLKSFSITDIQKNIKDVKDAKNIDKLDFYSPKNFSNAETHAYDALSIYL